MLPTGMTTTPGKHPDHGKLASDERLNIMRKPCSQYTKAAVSEAFARDALAPSFRRGKTSGFSTSAGLSARLSAWPETSTSPHSRQLWSRFRTSTRRPGKWSGRKHNGSVACFVYAESAAYRVSASSLCRIPPMAVLMPSWV